MPRSNRYDGWLTVMVVPALVLVSSLHQTPLAVASTSVIAMVAALVRYWSSSPWSLSPADEGVGDGLAEAA